MVSSTSIADVLVIGDGLIGLSTALELSRDAKVCVVGKLAAGIASTAAAGLLIPALDRLPPAARPFYADSLARYPQFIDSLRSFDPALVYLRGVIDRTATGDRLRQTDAAVDNVRLLAALRKAASTSTAITMVDDLATDVARDSAGVTVTTQIGARLRARRVVLAAGAWSPSIGGLPRPLAIRPLKGQMIALGATVLQQAMMGDDIYLVPRGDETIVGATVEERGFDLTLTSEAAESLRANAVALCPRLAGAKITRSWAGIRPATPDMLPILGADPDWPALIYACGHSKNGVLLTPATAVAIAAVCSDKSPPVDISPFSVSRFF